MLQAICRLRQYHILRNSCRCRACFEVEVVPDSCKSSMVVQTMEGKARSLILILWFYLLCGTLGLLVRRHVQGDVFQNLGPGTGFCTRRNAVCSVLQLSGECEDPRMTSVETTCPSCACQNGFRYSEELDFCEEGKGHVT